MNLMELTDLKNRIAIGQLEDGDRQQIETILHLTEAAVSMREYLGLDRNFVNGLRRGWQLEDDKKEDEFNLQHTLAGLFD